MSTKSGEDPAAKRVLHGYIDGSALAGQQPILLGAATVTVPPGAGRWFRGDEQEAPLKSMPVETFADDPEPADVTSRIRRYVEFWKLRDLVETGQLYLGRADKLDDQHEGLPPSEYERVLNLSR